jgi:hypothetical protein
VEVSERYAEGLATPAELHEAGTFQHLDHEGPSNTYAVFACAWSVLPVDEQYCPRLAGRAAGTAAAAGILPLLDYEPGVEPVLVRAHQILWEARAWNGNAGRPCSAAEPPGSSANF